MLRRFNGLVISLFLCCLSLSVWAEGGKIRVALDDLPGVDMLPILIAIERTKAKGVDINVSYMLSEGMAMRTIMNGQADVGMGAPYQQVQRSKAPIRMFYQLSKLRFHPVINAAKYQSWEALDGIEMYAHGAGSGTEAIMNMMAKKHGISYRKMIYLPGSGVRANAMINGRIHATVVDTERKNKLLSIPNQMFKLLPMGEINATDEALYANQAFMESNRKELTMLVTELLSVWRGMIENSQYVSRESQKYGLLKGYDREEVDLYYKEMVDEGAFSIDGGLETAFKADVDFYSFSGTLKGNKSTHERNEYWDFSILERLQSQ